MNLVRGGLRSRPVTVKSLAVSAGRHYKKEKESPSTAAKDVLFSILGPCLRPEGQTLTVQNAVQDSTDERSAKALLPSSSVSSGPGQFHGPEA